MAIKVGIGSMSEDLNRIFSPFEQVENSISRKFQGTGLGLSLTKHLVERFGRKVRGKAGVLHLFCLKTKYQPDTDI